jgi:hypothetical protein
VGVVAVASDAIVSVVAPITVFVRRSSLGRLKLTRLVVGIDTRPARMSRISAVVRQPLEVPDRVIDVAFG